HAKLFSVEMHSIKTQVVHFLLYFTNFIFLNSSKNHFFWVFSNCSFYYLQLICFKEEKCYIDKSTRKRCKLCRLNKCFAIGMKKVNFLGFAYTVWIKVLSRPDDEAVFYMKF